MSLAFLKNSDVVVNDWLGRSFPVECVNWMVGVVVIVVNVLLSVLLLPQLTVFTRLVATKHNALDTSLVFCLGLCRSVLRWPVQTWRARFIRNESSIIVNVGVGEFGNFWLVKIIFKFWKFLITSNRRLLRIMRIWTIVSTFVRGLASWNLNLIWFLVRSYFE